jgi:surface protein
MNKVVSFLRQYLVIISVLVGISILLSVTFSNFIVTSNNHKAAEMYIGELKYSMEINDSTTSTLTIPTGETIIDVKVNNLNPVDTYYKLLYLKNTNIIVKYYVSASDLDDLNNVVKTYDKPNDSVTSNGSKIVKLQITNNSTSSQSLGLSVIGGYITNTLNDIVVPSTHNEITPLENSTNTYFCKTNNTLTQGLQYVNGQYTYAYKQGGQNANSGLAWYNISNNGWGVQLTDKASTDAVTSKVCTYINNKPIVSMSYMFGGSKATTLDVSNFDTSKVTYMNGMFSNSKATTLDVSNFDTSNVTYMNNMFYYSQATTLDVSNFNTSNVTDMSSMFSYSKATTLDVSNFNTSNVTDMGSMFYYSQATTLDLSNFDTSKVTNMKYMFQSSQATTLDVSSFDTSKVTNMTNMFLGSQATTLDVSNFDTSNVTNMISMFSYSKATTLDVSNFDTSKVTNMSYMFYNFTNLKTIYVSNKFNTDKVTDSTNMFSGCTNLVGGAGTKYNSSYVDKTYARIDGGTSNPGYFTDIADKPSEPNSFATDSWKTIINAVKNNNIGKYNVGDTKTINMGTYGTHTLRIANTSTPSECSGTGFSQTACGFVLEFADIITTHVMNSSSTNVGGWPATSMRTFANNDIYNALPSDLRSAIINTTVVSSHGSEDTANFTSTDKLYLLSTAEVWAQGNSNTIDNDTARNVTRQLDYYKNLGTSTSDYSGAIKKNGNNIAIWYLRSASSDAEYYFYSANPDGRWSAYGASYQGEVSPAFRIG